MNKSFKEFFNKPFARQPKRRLSWSNLKSFFQKVASETKKDNIKTKAAALAYYGSLALAPFLILAVSISGFFLGQLHVQTQIREYFQDRFGPGVDIFVQNIFEAMSDLASNLIFTIIGLILIIYGVFFIFNYLRQTLFQIFDFDFKEKSFFRRNIKKQASSFLFMILIFFILLLILFFSLLSPLALSIGEFFFDTQTSLVLWQFWGNLASFIIVALLFALIYRSTSGFTLDWSSSFLGGIFASFLFAILNFLLNLYFAMISDLAIYGAAGFFIVILLWIYYSGIILFLGAEIAKVYNKLNEKEKEII